jgi:hypothetical protein
MQGVFSVEPQGGGEGKTKEESGHRFPLLFQLFQIDY